MIKKLFSSLVVAALVFVPVFAGAQQEAVTTSVESVNPSINIEFENFPEESDFQGDVNIEDNVGNIALGVGGLFAGLGLFVFFLLAVGVGLFVFWIVMLVHAAQHPIKSKAVWIVIMVLTGWLGALIYYFVVKRPFDRTHEVAINVVQEDAN